MHHRILPIPCKPYSLNWLPERLIVSHYENNYGAAVQSLNAVRDRLAGMDPDTSIAAEIRALRREELSAMAAVVLHELYFTNLSGDRKVPGEMMVAALEEHSGSVHRWRCEFVGAAQSLAGRSGRVLLSYSPHEGRLYNQIALEDAQTVPGTVPILCSGHARARVSPGVRGQRNRLRRGLHAAHRMARRHRTIDAGHGPTGRVVRR